MTLPILSYSRASQATLEKMATTIALTGSDIHCTIIQFVTSHVPQNDRTPEEIAEISRAVLLLLADGTVKMPNPMTMTMGNLTDDEMIHAIGDALARFCYDDGDDNPADGGDDTYPITPAPEDMDHPRSIATDPYTATGVMLGELRDV